MKAGQTRCTIISCAENNVKAIRPGNIVQLSRPACMHNSGTRDRRSWRRWCKARRHLAPNCFSRRCGEQCPHRSDRVTEHGATEPQICSQNAHDNRGRADLDKPRQAALMKPRHRDLASIFYAARVPLRDNKWSRMSRTKLRDCAIAADTRRPELCPEISLAH